MARFFSGDSMTPQGVEEEINKQHISLCLTNYGATIRLISSIFVLSVYDCVYC